VDHQLVYLYNSHMHDAANCFYGKMLLGFQVSRYQLMYNTDQ
jgi:hypothetical protein